MLRFATKLLSRSLLVAALSTYFGATASLAAPPAAPAERPLAPGVLTTIEPSLEPGDTVSTHDIIELRANPDLNWKPEFMAANETLAGMADQVKFRREIYCLEFAFKPLRMVDVDVPVASGGTEHKRVTYLVYCIRNTGQTLKPTEGKDGVYSIAPAKGGPQRFIPQFVLEAHDRQANGKPVDKSYLDRVIPVADAAIAARERIGQPLLNTVEIAEQPIPVSDGRITHDVWGVATWVDVDPRIDFFSIYVGGLTNAYRWTDNPAAYHPGDNPGRGRRFTHKMLELNFWRPGDELNPNERQFRYGPPLGKSDLYGVSDGVAYRWVYR
jgi:hypothetical protein